MAICLSLKVRKGQIRVLRGIGADGRAQTVAVFATGLQKPFGIAFYPLGLNPQYVYVANTDSVVRFAYQSGDLKARGKAQTVVSSIPGGGNYAAAAIGRATLHSRRMARKCSYRLARTQMWMMRRPRITARIFWSFVPMDRANESTHLEFEIL